MAKLDKLDKLHIGISGLGFVGTAIKKSLFLKGCKNIVEYDKYKDGGVGSFEDLLETDILFLCLPTQYDENCGQYELSAIEDTLAKLKSSNYKGALILKSTVLPQTTDQLAKKYGLQLVHNPEFLTARTAFDDFHNQSHVVLGRSFNCYDENVDLVIQFYTHFYPSAKISVCSSCESESMKMFTNSFYAVKVQFFNELYLLCSETGADYNTVKKMMLDNGWINPMHTDVPGPDGKLSYGGLCFPKDTNALLKFMERNGSKHGVLKATVKERNSMRDDKDNILENLENVEN